MFWVIQFLTALQVGVKAWLVSDTKWDTVSYKVKWLWVGMNPVSRCCAEIKFNSLAYIWSTDLQLRFDSEIGICDVMMRMYSMPVLRF